MLSLAVAALLTFHDVPKTSWAYPDVVLLSSAGAMHGERSGSFAPTGTVSREQAAATLARVLALPAAPLGAFRDRALVSPTLAADVARAVHAGVLEGTLQGYLDPRAPLTRAAAAALIARAFGIAAAVNPPAFSDAKSIPAYAQADVAALSAAGIVEGSAQGAFEPARPVTRAEWAALLLRAVIAKGGAPGVPSLVAGSLTAALPPNDPALAAQSSLGGQAGALEIAGRTLNLAQGALVYRQGASTGFFALGKGDPAAAWVGPDGSVALIEDLKTPAPDPAAGVVADLSPTALYLDSGAAYPAAQVILHYGSLISTLSTLPSYLLWAKVSVQKTGGTLTVNVASPYVFDLQGTIASVSQGALTLRLSASSALSPLVPALAAGDLVQVQTGTGTSIAGVGADAPQTPAIGLSAQVMGYFDGGAVAADRVTISQ
ncbi:MAG: S-layer homology domain-containing protein [Thermaerobacter sp.]|nr:S-layer homology domain-containing protein [Thermaerobacter sp.]